MGVTVAEHLTAKHLLLVATEAVRQGRCVARKVGACVYV